MNTAVVLWRVDDYCTIAGYCTVLYSIVLRNTILNQVLRL